MLPDSLTTAEWEKKIGSQIKALRLLKNMEQAKVAAQSGVSVTALKNLEAGRSTIKTLIKVLRVYDRESWLTTLAPSISISPLQMLTKKTPRLRARGKRKDPVDQTD